MRLPRYLAFMTGLVLLWQTSVAGLACYAQTNEGTAESQMAASRAAVETLGTPTASAHGFTVSHTYKIGNDDVLAVSVWHEPSLSVTVPVRPDGKISLPLVGEIQASGRTSLELQNELTSSLEKYIRQPTVTVIVSEIRSQRINVVGEVGRPGAFPLLESMGVVDAIAQAGGLKEFAKRKQIYVLRPTGDGRNTRLSAHYDQVLRGKQNAKDILLQAHDTVVVP
jgi:polysaccharide export outer membrane protein